MKYHSSPEIRPLDQFPNVQPFGAYSYDGYNSSEKDMFLPRDHLLSTLEGLENTDDESGINEVLDSAEKLQLEWMGGFVGLYLYGGPGNGKTHSAIAMGRMLAELGAEVSYLYAPEMRALEDDERLSADARLRTFNGWTKRTVFTKCRSLHKPYSHDSDMTIELDERRVLILDDLQPDDTKRFAFAVEAASQRGAMIIATSNYKDPFKVIEGKSPTSLEKIAIRDMVSRIDPAAVEELDRDNKDRKNEFSRSLRSRLASGFRFIEFRGEDRRPDRSFWA